MNKEQTDPALKSVILEQARVWIGGKRSPFVIAEEFTRHVAASISSGLAPDELLKAVLDCGFPCVRGDKGERVLWLRPTRAAGATAAPFVPTQAARRFEASATAGEQPA